MEASFSCFPAPASPGLLSGNGVCEATFLAHPGAFGKCAEPHDELFLPSPGLDLAEPTSAASHLPATPPSLYSSEDLEAMNEDLDAMNLPGYDASPPSAHHHGCCSEDLFPSGSQEQMQSDFPQGFVEESSLSCVDDLFPSSPNSGQDFSVWDGMYAWSVDSLPSIEAAFLTQEKKDLQVSRGGEDENASQMFARWLQSNAGHISLSDLRKIKLKTATIERATRQLGGGKRGLMLFLKFVLMWVQSSRLKPINAQMDEALTLPMDAHQQAYASLASQCLRPSPVNNVPRFSEGHAHSLNSPFLAHLVPSSLCSGWSTEASYEQPPLADDSVSSHGYGRNNGSPPHRTEICCAKNDLPCLAAGLYTGPNLSASGHTNHIGLHTGFEKDMTSSMLLLDQQRCCLSNPAATTRAARRSRMERQRWSLRHNRKCSASAHQSHHRLSPTASCCSQVIANRSPSFLHPGGRLGQQQQMGERSILEFPSNYRRPERNLRLLFQKELKQSDVGNLGRIVLPKREAEAFLPPLELRDGLNLLVEDMNSSKVWNMRYRFWPNNKSRMYLLENTGDFVKLYDLKEGDFMILFCKPETGNFVIRGAKGPGQAASSSDKEDDLPISCKEANRTTTREANCIVMTGRVA